MNLSILDALAQLCASATFLILMFMAFDSDKQFTDLLAFVCMGAAVLFLIGAIDAIMRGR